MEIWKRIRAWKSECLIWIKKVWNWKRTWNLKNWKWKKSSWGKNRVRKIGSRKVEIILNLVVGKKKKKVKNNILNKSQEKKKFKSNSRLINMKEKVN